MYGLSVLADLIGQWSVDHPPADTRSDPVPTAASGAWREPTRDRLLEDFWRGIDTRAAYRALNEIDTRTSRNRP